MEQKALQIGAAAVALALLLRLGGTNQTAGMEIARTLIFLSSGRLITETRPPETTPVTEPRPEEISATIPPAKKPEPALVFGEEDLQDVKLISAWSVDTLSLLREPLSWNLRSENPTVLILHSHATEKKNMVLLIKMEIG